MLFFCGFCVLLKILAAEACSANQQSSITLTGTNGTILTTTGRGALPMNATCQWTVTAPVGKVFRMDVLVMFLNFKQACSDDYVRIYDGPSTASDIMAEYKCSGGRYYSTYFFSRGRSFLLEAKTGSVANSTTMGMKYQALVHQECSINSTLDAPQFPTERSFFSPYFPLGYHMNMTCGWYITAPEDHIIKLQMRSKLGSPYDGDKDSVNVYEVDGSELIPISLSEQKIYSTLRVIYVVFKSDNETDKYLEKGIFVKYSAIKTVRSCSSTNTDEENKNILFKDPSGVIKTPGYPQGYSGNLITDCHWKITVPKGKVMRIEFTSFRLYEIVRRYDLDDSDDSAVIADSVNGLNPRSVEYSGIEPSFNFFSTGHELSIKVNSKVGHTGPGFIANYAAIPAVISGTCIPEKKSTVQMTGEGRSFSTPGYPSHPGKGTCSWNITVSPGEFVKLTFWGIKGSCQQNYVKVFDLTNSTRVLLGKYCSKYRKEVVYSRGSKLLVKYSSRIRYSLSASGFFATYESIKAIPAKYSGIITRFVNRRIELKGTSGEFASYNYPLPYANDAKCLWEIECPVGYVIQLTFHSFDLQQSQDCKADYVKIEQGKYSWMTGTVIGTFCGSTLPPVIQANNSNMYVDFVSDSSEKYPGFHASYKILRDSSMGPCKYPGQDNIIPMTGESGELFSPLYPRKFADNINCTWLITVPEGHFVKLRIKSFDFEGYKTCDRSSLDIRDGQSSSSGLLRSFCGYRFENSVFSNGRHLWVQFNSHNPSSGSSFYAVFEAVKQLPAQFACTASSYDKRFNSDTGTLASYNYPLPYDDAVECVWVMHVDTDYNIELSFDFFDLSQSSDCSEDYVEVRDGQFDISDLVGRYCGSEKPSSITSDNWNLHVTFKSSGKTKYPGFKATFEKKKTVGAILKIVGYVVGALSAFCALVGGCCKCLCKDDEPRVVQGTFGDEAEGTPLQEQATSL